MAGSMSALRPEAREFTPSSNTNSVAAANVTASSGIMSAASVAHHVTSAVPGPSGQTPPSEAPGGRAAGAPRQRATVGRSMTVASSSGHPNSAPRTQHHHHQHHQHSSGGAAGNGGGSAGRSGNRGHDKSAPSGAGFSGNNRRGRAATSAAGNLASGVCNVTTAPSSDAKGVPSASQTFFSGQGARGNIPANNSNIPHADAVSGRKQKLDEPASDPSCNASLSMSSSSSTWLNPDAPVFVPTSVTVAAIAAAAVAVPAAGGVGSGPVTHIREPFPGHRQVAHQDGGQGVMASSANDGSGNGRRASCTEGSFPPVTAKAEAASAAEAAPMRPRRGHHFTTDQEAYAASDSMMRAISTAMDMGLTGVPPVHTRVYEEPIHAEGVQVTYCPRVIVDPCTLRAISPGAPVRRRNSGRLATTPAVPSSCGGTAVASSGHPQQAFHAGTQPLHSHPATVVAGARPQQPNANFCYYPVATARPDGLGSVATGSVSSRPTASTPGPLNGAAAVVNVSAGASGGDPASILAGRGMTAGVTSPQLSSSMVGQENMNHEGVTTATAATTTTTTTTSTINGVRNRHTRPIRATIASTPGPAFLPVGGFGFPHLPFIPIIAPPPMEDMTRIRRVPPVFNNESGGNPSSSGRPRGPPPSSQSNRESGVGNSEGTSGGVAQPRATVSEGPGSTPARGGPSLPGPAPAAALAINEGSVAAPVGRTATDVAHRSEAVPSGQGSPPAVSSVDESCLTETRTGPHRQQQQHFGSVHQRPPLTSGTTGPGTSGGALATEEEPVAANETTAPQRRRQVSARQSKGGQRSMGGGNGLSAVRDIRGMNTGTTGAAKHHQHGAASSYVSTAPGETAVRTKGTEPTNGSSPIDNDDKRSAEHILHPSTVPRGPLTDGTKLQSNQRSGCDPKKSGSTNTVAYTAGHQASPTVAAASEKSPNEVSSPALHSEKNQRVNANNITSGSSSSTSGVISSGSSGPSWAERVKQGSLNSSTATVGNTTTAVASTSISGGVSNSGVRTVVQGTGMTASPRHQTVNGKSNGARSHQQPQQQQSGRSTGGTGVGAMSSSNATTGGGSAAGHRVAHSGSQRLSSHHPASQAGSHQPPQQRSGRNSQHHQVNLSGSGSVGTSTVGTIGSLPTGEIPVSSGGKSFSNVTGHRTRGGSGGVGPTVRESLHGNVGPQQQQSRRRGGGSSSHNAASSTATPGRVPNSATGETGSLMNACPTARSHQSSSLKQDKTLAGATALTTSMVQQSTKQVEAGRTVGQQDKEDVRRKASADSKIVPNTDSIKTSSPESLTADPTSLPSGVRGTSAIEDKAKTAMNVSEVEIQKQPSSSVEDELTTGGVSVRGVPEQQSQQQPTVVSESPTGVFSSNGSAGGGISWASIAATSKRAPTSSTSSTSGVPPALTGSSVAAVSSAAVTVQSHGVTGMLSPAVREELPTCNEIVGNAVEHGPGPVVGGGIKQRDVENRNEAELNGVVGLGGASSGSSLKKLGGTSVDGAAGVAAHLAAPLTRPAGISGLGTAAAGVAGPLGSSGCLAAPLPPVVADSPSARRKIGNAPLTSGMPTVIPPSSLTTSFGKITNPLVVHQDQESANGMEIAKDTNDAVEEERMQEVCASSSSLPVVLPPLALSSPALSAAQQPITFQSEAVLPVGSGCSMLEPTTVAVSSVSSSSSPNLKQETLSGTTAAPFVGSDVKDIKKPLDPSQADASETKTHKNTDVSSLITVNEIKEMGKSNLAIRVQETSLTNTSTTTSTTTKGVKATLLEETKKPTSKEVVGSTTRIPPGFGGCSTAASGNAILSGVTTSISGSTVTAAPQRVRSAARNKIKNVPAPMPVVLAQTEGQSADPNGTAALGKTLEPSTLDKDHLDKQALPGKEEKVSAVTAAPSAPAPPGDKFNHIPHRKTAATAGTIPETCGSVSENAGSSSSSGDRAVEEQHRRSVDTPSSSGAESSTTANLLTTTTGTTDTTSPRQPDGTVVSQGQDESSNVAGVVAGSSLERSPVEGAVVRSALDSEISAAQEAMTYSLPLMLQIRNYHQKHAAISNEALTGSSLHQPRQNARYIPLPGPLTGELSELSPSNDIEFVTGRVLTSTPSSASPIGTSSSRRARTTDLPLAPTGTEVASQTRQSTKGATLQCQHTSEMDLDEKTSPQDGRYSLAFLLGVKPENLSHLRGVGNAPTSGLSSALGVAGLGTTNGAPSSSSAVSGSSAGGYSGGFLAGDSGVNIGMRSAGGSSGGSGGGASSIATAHQIWRTAAQRAATGGGSPLRSGSLRRVPIKGGGNVGSSGTGNGLGASGLGGGLMMPRGSGGGGRLDHRRGDDSGRAIGTNTAGAADEEGWRTAPPTRPLPENNTRLQRAANVKEHGELIHRKLRSILNKLTVEKFNTLYEQIKNAGMVDAEDVKRLMELICSKAKTQHHFIPMYVKLCVLLDEDLPSMNIIGEGDAQFRRLLVDACQASFEETMKPIVIPEGLNDDDAFEFTLAEKKKMKGNMIFVAELSKSKMIATKVITNCIKSLIENRGEPQLEALSELLMTAGPHVCSGKLRPSFEKHMEQVVTMAKDSTLSVRIRCLLQDVVDDYGCGWKKASKDREGPTTLNALHQQVVDESRSKAAATGGSYRGGGGGGGGSGGGDYGLGSSMSFAGGSTKHSSRGGGDDDLMGGRGNCRGIRSNRFSGARDLNRMGGGGRDRDAGDYGLSSTFGGRRAMTSAISSSGGGGSGLSGLDRNGIGGAGLRASGGLSGASHRAAGLGLTGSGAGTRASNANGSSGFGSGPPAKEGRPVMSFFGSSSGTTFVDAPLSSPLLSQTPLPSTQTRAGVSTDAARQSRPSRAAEEATLPKKKPLDREDAQNRVMIVFDSLCSDSSVDDIEQALNSFKEYLAQQGGTEEDHIYLVSHMVYLISDARIAKQPVLSQWLSKCVTEKVLLPKVLEQGLQDFLEHRYSMTKCDTPNLRQLLENRILKDAQESGAVSPSFATELALEIERVDKLPSVYD